MQKAGNRQKVGEIELFRFIFSICVMFCHAAKYLIKAKVEPFSGGALAVEFFFILSGYLMMATIHKRQNTPITNLAGETTGFVWKKIAPIYPEILVSFLLAFAVKSLANAYTVGQMAKDFGKNIFSLFLVQNTGLGGNGINGAIWYIQAMLICMMILYPLIRKFPQMMTRVVLPLVALLLLGWLYQNYDHLRSPSLWIGSTFKGNVRAMAEISLGVVAFHFTGRLKECRLRLGARLALTGVKWLCWLAVLAYMWKERLDADFLCCFVFALAVVLAFSGQCVDARWYQNRFIFWLGKISLPIYLNHFYFARDLGKLLPEGTGNKEKMIWFFACTFVASLLVMLAAGGIRRAMPFVKRMILKESAS